LFRSALRASGALGTCSRELPRAIRSGQFAFIERGNYPFVALHVDNLVEAVGCVLAAETGGRAYFVNDTETVTFREFVNGLAKLQGLSTDKLRSMPYGLAFFLGRIMEMGAAIIRSDRDPPLSRTLVPLIGREFTTDDSAARHELGYVGRVSRAEGLAKYPA
jgi:nucleoside-diphosphate-sugar epimerase